MSFQSLSEQRFFVLQTEPCIEFDAAGRIRMANPAFCRASGRSAEALAGTSLLDVVHEQDRAAVQAALVGAAGKEALSFEARVIRPDGHVRWLEWHAVVFPEEGVFLQCVAHDVTRLRQAEAQTRERERFLDTLLANLPGMAYRCLNNPRWTVEFISRGCEELTGYLVEDFIDNSISFADIVHPDDRTRVWDVVQEAIARREPYVMQYRNVRRTGEVLWVHEQGRAVFADGELIALEGFVSDVTARVLAEEELRDKLRLIEEQLRLIEEQREQIRHLSLPIIEVWDGVLTLPVVGVLDDARASRIMEGLLEAVVRTQSRHVIVDLTAVEAIDAAVAEHLVRMIRAVELLGARGVLAGMQPAVAQTLVSLQVELGGIPALADLRGALLDCLRVERAEMPRKQRPEKAARAPRSR
jgi:PAS domain S-box-containing protein